MICLPKILCYKAVGRRLSIEPPLFFDVVPRCAHWAQIRSRCSVIPHICTLTHRLSLHVGSIRCIDYAWCWQACCSSACSDQFRAALGWLEVNYIYRGGRLKGVCMLKHIGLQHNIRLNGRLGFIWVISYVSLSPEGVWAQV